MEGRLKFSYRPPRYHFSVVGGRFSRVPEEQQKTRLKELRPVRFEGLLVVKTLIAESRRRASVRMWMIF
jgi:hypothetical protein